MRLSSSLPARTGSSRVLDEVGHFTYRVQMNMRPRRSAADEGLEREYNYVKKNGLLLEQQSPSLQDYSWDSSKGIRFASGQERAKDLSWRPEYGLVFINGTGGHMKTSSQYRAPEFHKISRIQINSDRQNRPHDKIPSLNISSSSNQEIKPASNNSKEKCQFSACRPRKVHTHFGTIPGPNIKGIEGEHERLSLVAQARIREQSGVRKEKSHRPKVDKDARHKTKACQMSLDRISDKPVVYADRTVTPNHYSALEEACLRLKDSFEQTRIMVGRVIRYQYSRLRALHNSKMCWEKAFAEIDNQSSLLNDAHETILKANCSSKSINIHSSPSIQGAGVYNSLVRMLSSLTTSYLNLKLLLQHIRYRKLAQDNLDSLSHMRSLLTENVRDICEYTYYVRLCSLIPPQKTPIENISLIFILFQKASEDILEFSQDIRLLRLQSLINTRKLNIENKYTMIRLIDNERSLQKLDDMYGAIKISQEEFCTMFGEKWFREMQRSWFVENASAKQIYEDWHIRPFISKFTNFQLLQLELQAYKKSVARKEEFCSPTLTTRELRIKKLLTLLANEFVVLGRIEKFQIKPLVFEFSAILDSSVEGMSDDMLQRSVKALKMAKQERSFVSYGRAEREMRSATKGRSHLTFGSRAGLNHRPPVQEISSVADNAIRVIKVPTELTSNLKNTLQARGMHTCHTNKAEGNIIANSGESSPIHESLRVTMANGVAKLKYHIPLDILQSAMRASPRTPAAYWSYDMYRGPSNDRIKLHYCYTKKSVEAVCKHFVGQPVLGFDMEWDSLGRSGLKNKVSLIQIASEDRIALFHIALFEEEDIPANSLPTLKAIMESRDIVKAGVSILGDCTRLRNNIGIDARGLIELSHLHNLVKHFTTQPDKVSKRAVALAAQVEEHLQLPLHKGDVRGSDWTQRLSPEQMIYAASDAYAGLRLYHVLEKKRLDLQPVPPRPAHADLGLPIKLAEVENKNECEIIVDEKVIAKEPTILADQLTCSIPIVTSEGSETHENSLSSTCLSADLENGPLSRIGVQKGSRGVARLVNVSPFSRPEIEEAEAWVERWRASRPPSIALRTSITNLRVYALWHAQSLELSQIASMLRDPPLQLSTVSCYVLECLKTERLPFDQSRIQDVIKLLPRFLVQRKYKYFLQRAGLNYNAIR